MSKRSYNEENAFQRERLKALVARLSDDDLRRELDKLSDDMLAELVHAGHPIKLSRAEHRASHLDEIEQLIG